MTIEEKLKKYIIDKYSSIYAFSKATDIKDMTIRSIFKRSVSKSTGEILFKICTSLNIDFYALMKGDIEERTYTGYGLTHKEENLIDKYRSLDDFGVDAVDTILGIETSRNLFYDNKIKYIYKPLTFQSAAAGFGDIVSDDDYEMVKLPRTSESELADFVIRVTGDAMEPEFYDRDCVLIRKQISIYDGDVGLFVYQGDVFIKIWQEGQLRSLNQNYAPIKITDWDRFQTVGKVLGKTEIVKE